MQIFEVFPDVEGLAAQGFSGVSCDKPAVMIAMTPRTGSTHLCAILAAAAGISQPTEIFNPREVAQAEARRRGVTSFAEYVRSFALEPGAPFVFKTCWHDFAPFAAHVDRLFADLTVVYLDRRDVIAQAVSMFRALASGQWHRPRGQAPGASTVGFDLADICRIMARLEAEKADWETWFSARGTAPARLFYEDFEHDVSHALGVFSTRAGVALTRAPGAQDGLDRLADAVSEDWVNRVRRHVLRLS